MSEIPIACNLGVFSDEEHARYAVAVRQLGEANLGVDDLPDGYSFRYPAGRTILLAIAEFVALESRCCPFFDFEVSIPKNGGSVSLRIMGGEGVKPFIREELKIARTRV
ncbi:MAG: hypothetical protein JWQ02_2899 [Capsulimonas sp.]|jgi:hypothetical protein|nr:hypothetical protein [Capsulimonas sp.]